MSNRPSAGLWKAQNRCVAAVSCKRVMSPTQPWAHFSQWLCRIWWQDPGLCRLSSTIPSGRCGQGENWSLGRWGLWIFQSPWMQSWMAKSSWWVKNGVEERWELAQGNSGNVDLWWRTAMRRMKEEGSSGHRQVGPPSSLWETKIWVQGLREPCRWKRLGMRSPEGWELEAEPEASRDGRQRADLWIRLEWGHGWGRDSTASSTWRLGAGEMDAKWNEGSTWTTSKWCEGASSAGLCVREGEGRCGYEVAGTTCATSSWEPSTYSSRRRDGFPGASWCMWRRD